MEDRNFSTDKTILTIKEKLLNSETRKYVMKLILFGSYVKNEARQNSDIDLLIVRSNGKRSEQIIEQLLYDIMIEFGYPLEFLICPVDEYLFPDNYFLYNILSYGKEVFSMDKDVIKDEAIKGLLELSEEYIRAAEDCAKFGHWRLAIDAAYNSAELIAKALILKKIDDLPGSHGGVVSKFGELYVKTKDAPDFVGRGLNRALQIRNWARYKWETKIEQKEYDEVYNLVKELEKIVSLFITKSNE